MYKIVQYKRGTQAWTPVRVVKEGVDFEEGLKKIKSLPFDDDFRYELEDVDEMLTIKATL
jgi:hypothetical protein